MKTSVEQSTPTHVTLTIRVEPADLKPRLDEAYRMIGGQIQVPGFRKGKVPAAIIDQRIGRAAVLEQAVSDGLDGWYNQAVEESGIKPIGRPRADVAAMPDPADLSGDVVLNVEVDVRPEFELPDYRGMRLEVASVQISEEDVDAEMDALRGRFGTLVTVDRPVRDGDFVTLDLVAEVDGERVDEAKGISYEVGSGQLLDGIDEALDTLTAGEETTFASTLLGGEHEGADAQITVTVGAVKERELPEVDEDFVQSASEFDTVEELREDLRAQAAKRKRFEQVDEARDQIVDRLLEQVEIPLPERLIEDEVARHLEQEGLAADDEHAAEVRPEVERSFRQQMLMDEIIRAEDVQVEQDELTQFLIQSAQQYGMNPQEFVNVLQENGQFMGMVGQLARSKALLYVLDAAEVVDADGEPVDVSEFTSTVERDREKRAQARAGSVPTEDLVEDSASDEPAEAPAAE
ncbi:MAG: trigger factor [Pseudoclavibacter sp.]|nr:trigger factor [Pseudoclavibacter sp.]